MLKGPPFEPIRLAPLKWLTYKTLFLVAFASARRRGELHALVVDQLGHSDHWMSCTIYSDPTFVSKTHVPSRGTGMPPLVIPALPRAADPLADEDGAVLCPVRAVNVYTHRVECELERGARRKLFISHSHKHKGELSAATLAFWIRDTVLQCYKRSSIPVQQQFKVTPHALRGFATSWAVTNRANVADVMGAAMWRAPTTFTTFYLRDVTNIVADMNRVGPVVSALHVV